MVEALREHPEYYGVWDRVDELSDEELIRDGVNPILHVTIHQTVENQLAAKDPPVVHETLERLMRSGLSRHAPLLRHRRRSTPSDRCCLRKSGRSSARNAPSMRSDTSKGSGS
jgi:hypothetical protein